MAGKDWRRAPEENESCHETDGSSVENLLASNDIHSILHRNQNVMDESI